MMGHEEHAMNRTRALPLAAALLLAACATTSNGKAYDPWAATAQLGPLQVALLYHQRTATTPPPALSLAWRELCQVGGAEAQTEAVKRASSRLAVEADRVAAEPRWQVQVRQPLGPYDLQSGGFHSVLKAGSVIRFDPFNYCFRELRYLLAFRNGGSHAILPLEEAAAKALLRRDPTRAVTIDLMVEPVATQVEHGEPILVVDITRLRVTDGTNTVLLDTGAER
jgi:hypothetical protein